MAKSREEIVKRGLLNLPVGYTLLPAYGGVVVKGDLWLRPTDGVWIESSVASWGREPGESYFARRTAAGGSVGERSVAGIQNRVDALQYHLGKLPQLNMPLVHRFTPGLYVREITMPAGSVVISRVHKTEHPFVISKGRCSVWSEENGVVHLAAPHCGITRPGTRRILVIHEETIWTTFHPTTVTDVKALEAELTDLPDVSYMEQMAENFRIHGPELKVLEAAR